MSKGFQTQQVKTKEKCCVDLHLVDFCNSARSRPPGQSIADRERNKVLIIIIIILENRRGIKDEG